MEDSLEKMFLIFDVLDRWGLDEIESVLCPFCDAPNEVEVSEEEPQEEDCEACGGRYWINWREIQNSH